MPFLHRYGAHCCVEQVDTTEGYPKFDLFTFKGYDRELHIGWSYGIGPKVNMRLFWIAYVCTLSDFLYLLHSKSMVGPYQIASYYGAVAGHRMFINFQSFTLQEVDNFRYY